MAESFSYKITAESELYSFDFSQVLAADETILTSYCTIEVMSGTDNNPNDIKVGASYFTGQIASQRIAGGISEVTYRLEMEITTSLGNTYIGVGDLSVYDPDLV